MHDETLSLQFLSLLTYAVPSEAVEVILTLNTRVNRGLVKYLTEFMELWRVTVTAKPVSRRRSKAIHT
jgi:hypothetical protein